MFKILSLETSTECGSVAVLDRDRLLAETSFGGGITHTERLLPALEFVLRQARIPLAEIDGLAVGIGPGSFTGLRIGMATAFGLSWSRKLPLIGISSLAALALNLPFAADPVCAMIDARKGEIYWGLFRAEAGGLTPLGPERVSPVSAVFREVGTRTIFLGTGAERYADSIRAGAGAGARLAEPALAYPRSEKVGLLAWNRFSRGESDDLFNLSPNYLRRSEAELARPELRPEELFLERRRN